MDGAWVIGRLAASDWSYHPKYLPIQRIIPPIVPPTNQLTFSLRHWLPNLLLLLLLLSYLLLLLPNLLLLLLSLPLKLFGSFNLSLPGHLGNSQVLLSNRVYRTSIQVLSDGAGEFAAFYGW